MLDFWQFVEERERIRLKREAGEPRPWTDDKVLNDTFFTNIFREDDPGTQPVFDIMNHSAPAWERLLNVILYRRVGKQESWRGFVTMNTADVLDHTNFLRSLDWPLTGAYVVPTQRNDHLLATDNVGRICEGVLRSKIIAMRLALQLPLLSRREAYERIVDAQIWGVGAFLSWQIALDLTYGKAVVRAPDDWAPFAQGAARGLTWFRSWPELPPIKERNGAQRVKLDSTVILERTAERVLQQQQLKRPLTHASLEHAMCEWSKYVSVNLGGRRTRKY